MKIYFESIAKQYGMPFLKKGLAADVNGKRGRIAKANVHGLWIEFDDGGQATFHPTWQTTYYDEQGNVIKDYKK